MKLHKHSALLLLALVVTGAFAASPYAGQQSREIKALSSEEVAFLLAGKGMGFAKAAELNGFAGPSHVLELAQELQLTAQQRVRTEALFASMAANAMAAGRMLVISEQELDRLFATNTVSPSQLSVMLREIGALQAQVREAHLQAHLAQVEILTPQQNARYGILRGYGPAAEQPRHEHRH